MCLPVHMCSLVHTCECMCGSRWGEAVTTGFWVAAPREQPSPEPAQDEHPAWGPESELHPRFLPVRFTWTLSHPWAGPAALTLRPCSRRRAKETQGTAMLAGNAGSQVRATVLASTRRGPRICISASSKGKPTAQEAEVTGKKKTGAGRRPRRPSGQGGPAARASVLSPVAPTS